MIILPAIDIKDGNCVRLFKGDFSTVEKVAADYMETAKGFEIAGASWIHMVDLDGAKEGRPMNQHIYEDVAAKTGLKVEVGGGIRNLETIDTYLKSGVERVILGSAALKNPQLVKDAVQKFGSQHIAVGIDAKNGMVATEGWLEESDTDYITLAKEMIAREKAGKGFNFFHFMIDLTGGPCVYKRLSGCGSGTEYMAVTPWGDLYPCHQFVGEEAFKLGDIYTGVTNKKIQDEFASCNVYARKECADCWARLYCSGGCAANAYHATGSVKGVYKEGCELFCKGLECGLAVAIIRDMKENNHEDADC